MHWRLASQLMTPILSQCKVSTWVLILLSVYAKFSEKPDPPINPRVISITARSVILSWGSPFNGNLDILGYKIYQNDTDRMVYQFVSSSSESNYTTASNTIDITENIFPYSSYVFRVVACNSLGCSGDSTVSVRTDTAGEFTTDLWWLCVLLVQPTALTAPEGAPLDLSGYSDSSTSIIISWKEPSRLLRNGLITRHVVTYTSDLSTSTPGVVVNTTELRLERLAIFTEYSILVASGTSVGYGPVAMISVRTLNDSKPTS